ncbi:MAG: hypothetical protein HOQ05_04260 [Corynebacteriales bacterium]|nr:hypothetical protein [Mycobacteriales bacterium]
MNPDAQRFPVNSSAPPSTHLGSLQRWIDFTAATSGEATPIRHPRAALFGGLTAPEAHPWLPNTVIASPVEDKDRARQWTDRAVDGGADLIIPLVHTNEDLIRAAYVVVSVLTDTEPVWVQGFTEELSDQAWADRCAAVRDETWRMRRYRIDQAGVLAGATNATFGALVDVLHQATVRKTPVLLDGPVVAAAALVVSKLDADAATWFFVPQHTGIACERIALDACALRPLFDLEIKGAFDGVGALVLLPLLQTLLRGAHQAS